MPVTFLLVTRNRPNILRRCLASLIAQTCHDWHLYIVHLDDQSEEAAQVLDVIRDYPDPRIDCSVFAHTPQSLEKMSPHSHYVNFCLDYLKDQGYRGIVAYPCANVEYDPETVALVLFWFERNHEIVAGYVKHERDIWDTAGLNRLGPASMNGHWDIVPPEPGQFITDARGMLDCSQVFHRFQPGLYWSEKPEHKRGNDGEFFTRLAQVTGPIHAIHPGRVLSHEHLM